jgi:hypothetical protein
VLLTSGGGPGHHHAGAISGERPDSISKRKPSRAICDQLGPFLESPAGFGVGLPEDPVGSFGVRDNSVVADSIDCDWGSTCRFRAPFESELALRFEYPRPASNCCPPPRGGELMAFGARRN